MHRISSLAVASLALALVASPTPAHAQPVEAGVNAVPTTMVLLDTSGSMEWRDDGLDNSYPACVEGAPGDGISRLHAAIEVLTGTVPDRYCQVDLRNQDPNRIDQVDPTRPQGIRHSRLCSPQGPLTNPAVDCTPVTAAGVMPNLNQRDDGLIDAFGDFIHFGLMSFDSFEEESECADGMFSYGRDRSMRSSTPDNLSPVWSLPGSVSSCAANPTGRCWNLGARRPYDPAAAADGCGGDVYQGMTVAPLDPTGATSRQAINSTVQNEIVRTLPYWSTPLGAMLEDAYTFYFAADERRYFDFRDADGRDYSMGYEDPYLECRRRYVLLITDGIESFEACERAGDTPNSTGWLPGCENYPYASAEYYAAELSAAGVPVYVVGFNIPDSDARAKLDGIAAAGGTDEARFADSGLSLIFELGDIFSQISQGTPSRTPPATTSRLSAGGRGQYQFRSNFEIHEGSPYWTGEVTKLTQECVSGDLGEVQTYRLTDTYDALSLSDLEKAEYFTSSPATHSCQLSLAGAQSESLFDREFGGLDRLTDAEIAAACQVGDVPGGSTSVLDPCKALTNGGVGLGIDLPVENDTNCLVELEIAQSANLMSVLGAQTPDQAAMFNRWLRGFRLSELRGQHPSALADLLPTAEFRYDDASGTYSNDRRHRVGAVYHSAPIVVSVPDPSLQISPGYEQYAEDVSGRDTFVYVVTTDGVLRAVNAKTMEQAWAFLPSSVAYRVGDTLQSQVTLTDGTPVASDLRVMRTAAGGDVWRTVLLFGMRGGGRGYVALDVTDPYEPRFLWELDGELDPMLGNTFSVPAMGTVFLGDGECPQGGAACERGIAVLAGGVSPDGFGTNSNIGKVVYVVDVLTGRVLRRFTQYRDESGVPADIPDPVVGDVALFDNFGGALVTRAFMGDSAGRIFRLDLSGATPESWSLDLFFDGQRMLQDESIAAPSGAVLTRPTIALRRPDNRAVVLFGTGDLDDLDSVTAEQNFVASVTEQPLFADGVFVRMSSELNWALLLEDNERLTARPRVFNRRATFATFVPDENLCEIGGARLYQFDYLGAPPGAGLVSSLSTGSFPSYLRQDATGPDLDDDNPYVSYWDATTTNSPVPPKSIIYSLEFVEKLSCFNVASPPGTGSPGSAPQDVLQSQAGGETVLQLGISTYVEDADSGATGAVSDVAEIPLGRVPSYVFPTSWSVILD